MTQDPAKVALVTGGRTGIGNACAQRLAREGLRVITAQRESADDFETIPADLTDTDTPARIIDGVIERAGRLDVLVNNAAITLPGAPPYDDATWNTTLDVNLSGAFRMARAAATAMAETGGGSIIHIASIAGIVAMPGNPSYSAAKAGLRHLSKAMANDFATRDVRVNTICPGYIVTDMTRASFLDPQRQAERSARTMMGRWGQPEELLGPCLFLASDASSYVTGIDLVVDGGWTGKGM